jgi:hypothetical protein
MATNRPRILVRFKGGLANQIYQLAAATHLANKLGTNVHFSDCYYRLVSNSRNLSVPAIYDKQLVYWRESIANLYLYRITNRLGLDRFIYSCIARGAINVSDDNLDSLLDCDSNEARLSCGRYVLDGYFHQSKYLEASDILSSLSILGHPASESLGIHLRMGDYLISPYREFYRLVNSQYVYSAYKKLIDYGMDPSLPIFLYSDSPTVASRVLLEALPNKPFKLRSSRSALSDLRSLSSHNYQILSNSSFSLISWYLNTDSISVSPSEWFRDKPTDQSQFPVSPRFLTIPLQ